jgi:hypothetical protein
MLCGAFVGAVAFFVILNLPYTFSLTSKVQNTILWFAFDIYLIMRGVTQTLVWRMSRQKE